MNNFWAVYGIVAGVIWIMMTIVWLISLKIKDTSIVDIVWGLGFVIANWTAFFLTPHDGIARKWLINALVTIWGLRLSIHIFLRNIGKGEDFRYAEWRKQHGKNWWWYSYLQTFLLQGFLMWLISAPLIKIQVTSEPSPLGILAVLGMLFWIIGFFFEAVGDAQLARFKKDPANKGKVLKTGVWRYTRHPNYFGDAAQWWGFFLIAAGVHQGFLTVFSPIIMTIFLIKVSGVAMLEKSIEERRPGYKEYIETTSPFIPWFPKKQ